MTNKEAIKLLKTILRTVCLGNQKFIDAVKKAISVMEKQETAKIIVGKSKGGVTLWHECSKCGDPVDAKDIFCRRCGRKLIYETE